LTKPKKAASSAKKKPRKNSKADLKIRTYHSWSSMLQRCYNQKHVSYMEYGGRDIKVCARWTPSEALGMTHKQAYANFLADVGFKPSSIHTLDRLNANGNYEPSNCKWATPKEQGVNKRTTHYVLHYKTGVRIAAATLADEMGIRYQQVRAMYMRSGKWYELHPELQNSQATTTTTTTTTVVKDFN
jgi:hypothetical protein